MGWFDDCDLGAMGLRGRHVTVSELVHLAEANLDPTHVVPDDEPACSLLHV